MDRLVGYELSPLLWKKIKYGLSAGRVQSVAVRMVVEREREIEAFKPEEYWSITAELSPEKGKEMFQANLAKFKGENIKVGNEAQSKEILENLKGATYEVTAVEKKESHRNPAPPFTTSTLQQEAARKLGFSVKKTMMVAQHLYEGVELETGHEGLITYMRTDSVNVSQIALKQAQEVIGKLYGKEYGLTEPRYYKGRKGAQEAHEAIRPSDLSRARKSVNSFPKTNSSSTNSFGNACWPAKWLPLFSIKWAWTLMPRIILSAPPDKPFVLPASFRCTWRARTKAKKRKRVKRCCRN